MIQVLISIPLSQLPMVRKKNLQQSKTRPQPFERRLHWLSPTTINRGRQPSIVISQLDLLDGHDTDESNLWLLFVNNVLPKSIKVEFLSLTKPLLTRNRKERKRKAPLPNKSVSWSIERKPSETRLPKNIFSIISILLPPIDVLMQNSFMLHKTKRCWLHSWREKSRKNCCVQTMCNRCLFIKLYYKT